METRHRPVCILGMHRSGTSLVARCLNLLGVSLGKRSSLMRPADGNNPSGFWEHLGPVEINEAILKRFGGSWHEPPRFPHGWERSEDLEDLRQRARKLIREEFGGMDLWGWKDPRTCLTVPFWRQIVPELQYVICLRNPLDVIGSLGVRDGFAVEKSSWLWLEYNLAAFVQTAGHPRIVTFFDSYFSDLEGEIGRLARFLGCRTAERSEADKELRDFVQKGLRHHRASLTEVMNGSELDLPGKAFTFAVWSTLGGGENAAEPDEEGPAWLNPFLQHLEDSVHTPEYQHLRDTMRDQATRIVELSDRLAQREAMIERLVGSRSWKVTAPLRRLSEGVRARREKKKKNPPAEEPSG